MTYLKIREKFIDFFVAKGHTLVTSSSLIPENDTSVLLTTAGMQQFKPYFTGQKADYGTAVSIQKCFRTSDINEVGDDTHLSFFEMFGNFAFNGKVSKKQSIDFAWEFLTDHKWMDISKDRITATYYNGNRAETVEDIEGKEALEQLDGLKEISAQPDTENFWGPTGSEGPCGPTIEFHVDGVEVWNIVFNEFYCSSNGELKKSKGLGIDTGMGLERLLTTVTDEATNIFETDAFIPIIDTIKKHTPGEEIGATESIRIVVDHLRGSVFLMSDHIQPSNKEQGYILRRLLRRAILHLDKLEALNGFEEIIESIIIKYADAYPDLLDKRDMVLQLAKLEKEKFLKTIVQGRKELGKILTSVKSIDGETAFNLFATYGLPLDFIKEEALKHKLELDEAGFEVAFKAHQDVSRAGAEKKFGGHGLSSGAKISEADAEKITRLHTATHLLHAGLIKFLGDEIKQAGSDLTTERARYDFTFSRALTDEEKSKIEAWVNDQIKRDLLVQKETKPLQEALDDGAVAFFKQRYPEEVDVYSIYDPDTNEIISKELCGGPHVQRTNEIGEFKIIKEQSSSAGIRRIRAVVN